MENKSMIETVAFLLLGIASAIFIAEYLRSKFVKPVHQVAPSTPVTASPEAFMDGIFGVYAAPAPGTGSDNTAMGG